jgi:hypothetical protein
MSRLSSGLPFLGLLSFANFTAAATPRERVSNLDTLSVSKELSIPTPPVEATTARDVRWDSDGNVYLAYGSGGVISVALNDTDGKRKPLFQPHAVRNLWNLAVSQRAIIGFSPTGDIGWRSRTAGSEVQIGRIPGLLEAMDVQGDKVALLGHPGSSEFRESGWAFLWSSTLRDGLTSWKPIGGLFLTSSADARVLFNRLLGSLRFLPSGDLIVVPGAKPGVFLVSSAGKVKRHWSPPELEASLREALGESEEAPPQEQAFDLQPAQSMEQVVSELDGRRFLVEDVVPIRKKPAIVVRYRSPDGVGFYLGVLSDEISWHELPLDSHPGSARIRSDFFPAKGTLAILATDRGRSQGTTGKLYILEGP